MRHLISLHKTCTYFRFERARQFSDIQYKQQLLKNWTIYGCDGPQQGEHSGFRLLTITQAIEGEPALGGRKLSSFREFFRLGRIQWIFFRLWGIFISTSNYI